MLTADTITDEQIRDVLRVAERETREQEHRVRLISIDAPACIADLIAANWALGNFEDYYFDDTGFFHRIGGKYADRAKCERNGRARCAEILNQRTANEISIGSKVVGALDTGGELRGEVVALVGQLATVRTAEGRTFTRSLSELSRARKER